MRPNLMSPRRLSTSGEDSILAMLEREPARKRGKGASSAQLAWYGVGATVALALTGALVWMAANNDGLRPEVQETVLADAGTAPQLHPAAGGATIVQLAMAPAAAAIDAQPRTSAVIVDQPPAEAVPPLRLLKPAPDMPTPAARAAAPRTAAPAPAAAPARPVATSTPPPRPALAAATAAAAGPKPATRSPAAASAPVRLKTATVAKNALRPAQPRTQRNVNPARAADAGVDADVALISAVIVHANGHAPEGSQMTELLCPNDNCQARPSRQ